MSRASSSRFAERIEKRPHGLRRDREAVGALAAEDRRHRRQEFRLPRGDEGGIGAAKAVDPGDFRKQPDHARERKDDADQEDADDQPVEPRVGHERVEDLMLQDKGDQPAQNQKHQHPEQKDAGRRQLGWVDVIRHRPLG